VVGAYTGVDHVHRHAGGVRVGVTAVEREVALVDAVDTS
jgi:hypothetical protein